MHRRRRRLYGKRGTPWQPTYIQGGWARDTQQPGIGNLRSGRVQRGDYGAVSGMKRDMRYAARIGTNPTSNVDNPTALRTGRQSYGRAAGGQKYPSSDWMPRGRASLAPESMTFDNPLISRHVDNPTALQPKAAVKAQARQMGCHPKHLMAANKRRRFRY